MKLMQLIKRYWWKAFLLGLAFVLFVAAINIWMVRSGRSACYSNLEEVPGNDVGLVLGTGARISNGRTNLHFVARINAAAQLYYAGKVKHLILSGDNHTRGYDEPTDMKAALVQKGIPERAMTLDYAGLRTLDSVVRAKEIFGQTNLTIITQEFHGPRAAYLAKHFGLNAVVFCAERLPKAWESRAGTREIGARVKAFLDLYIFHRGPRHLGDKIKIDV